MGQAKQKAQLNMTLADQLGVAWQTLGALLTNKIKTQYQTIQNGDLVIVYALEGQDPQGLVQAGKHLTDALRKNGHDVTVITVPHDFKLDVVGADTMESLGWVRQQESLPPE